MTFEAPNPVKEKPSLGPAPSHRVLLSLLDGMPVCRSKVHTGGLRLVSIVVPFLVNQFYGYRIL